MQNQEQMGARMLEILMRGVSTRNYKEVIPAMAETAEFPVPPSAAGWPKPRRPRWKRCWRGVSTT